MNRCAIDIPAPEKRVFTDFGIIVRLLKRLLRFDRLSFVIFLGSCWLLTVWAGAVEAQDVQTGHYAPGWNGNLKAGMMAPDPGFYMQSTTMFFNARKFKDGSGDTASSEEPLKRQRR